MEHTPETPAAEVEVAAFESLFAADQEPVRVPFTVAGRGAWVELTPMDAADHSRFSTIGLKYKLGDGGLQNVDITEVDQAAREQFLVQHTVTDWLLWQRQGRALNDPTAERGWQQVGAPEHSDPKKQHRMRQEFLAGLKCQRAFWEWLVRQCVRVNGLDGETVGN